MKKLKQKSTFTQFFGDNPFIRVVDFLIENKDLDYSKQEIARGVGISRTTLYTFWDKIEQLGLVKVKRTFANTKLFVLNEDNPIVKRLLKLELDLIKFYAEVDTRSVAKPIRIRT